MSYRSLADFLEELGHAGELVRVETEVQPVLEVAEITRRVARGPALLFGAVAGHDVPVLTNLLGTEERICRVLGVPSLREAAERITALVAHGEPEGWLERLRATSSSVRGLGTLAARQIKSGPCQQIVRLGRDVDLGVLPLLTSAPQEAGPAITAAAVFTADPETRRQTAGRFVLQLLGPDRLAVCWAAHDEHARLLLEYGQRRQPMPLAVVLGGDPAVLLAAAAAVPPDVDTCSLAGLLRQKPLETVACRSVELSCPAEADIVLEGYVDPSEPPAMAGPLCTPLGLCHPPRPAPIVHVTAITHRANPVFPAMIPGPPPHEAALVAGALSRVFLPLVRLAIPEMIDYDLPIATAVRHSAAMSIRKTYAGQARRAAALAWGQRQLMFAKVLVVVDEEVDVHDQQEVLAAVARHVDPGRDVFFQQGPPDPIDPAAPPDALGHRMGIDATAKLPGEPTRARSLPATISEEIRRLASDRWVEYGLGPEP